MDLELTPLRAIADLEQVITDSHTKPILLFKHSYTCGISAEALDELRMHLDEQVRTPTSVKYAMVTVQTHREVSNAIAAKLGVRHETPQAILVHGGRAVWSASHFRVNAAELQKAVATVPSA
jgi:bacillithiol system protein YtxJ